MPTYEFVNHETGEYFEKLMGIIAKEQFLKENPHIEQVHLSAAATVSGVSIKDKVPAGFKEVLAKVSESHKSSSVADKHGKKSIKEVKTREIVDKHYKKQLKS